MHTQTFPYHKEKIAKTNSERQIINDRYMDFLLFALHRIIETALLYESQAKKCVDSVNKLFLYYLAGKKRVQHVVLEMIAVSNQGHPLALSNYNSLKAISEILPSESLFTASCENILHFAHQRAEKDLNLYTSLAALEEDAYTKKLLSTLSKLSKDFINDITTGYEKFTFSNNLKTNALIM